MKKAIITGTGGFIGSALAMELLKQGYVVYGVSTHADRLGALLQQPGFIPVSAGFQEYEHIDRIITERGFDHCFHAAWDISSSNGISNTYFDYTLQNRNVEAACKIADMSVKLGVKRFIFCGSNFQAMTSKDTHSPIHYYGIAKQTAADYTMAICKRNGIECNVGIINNAYGAGDRSQKSMNTFLKKLLLNEDLYLIDGNDPIDWVYITDVVNGLISAARSEYSFKAYHIGHQKIGTFREKLTLMKQILGSDSKLLFGRFNDNTYIDYSSFELDALHHDTGFECKTDFAESILQTAAWVKSNFLR